MSLSSAIIKAESLCKTNNKNYCIVDYASYNKLSKEYVSRDVELSGDLIMVSTHIMSNFPNLNVLYDTVTKETSDEKRRAKIIEYLYNAGFEASPCNTDLALWKFYSIESDTFRIRIEMCKNGIITIFIFDRRNDSTRTRSEFFDPLFIQDAVKDFLTIDEKRELMLKKLLKNI
jgi:hypothetical protein